MAYTELERDTQTSFPASFQTDFIYAYHSWIRCQSLTNEIFPGFVLSLALSYELGWKEGKAACYKHYAYTPQLSEAYIESHIEEEVPVLSCTCGYYGSKSIPTRNFVVGIVKLWGKVIEHEEGYRAQYCQVHKILDDENFRHLTIVPDYMEGKIVNLEDFKP